MSNQPVFVIDSEKTITITLIPVHVSPSPTQSPSPPPRTSPSPSITPSPVHEYPICVIYSMSLTPYRIYRGEKAKLIVELYNEKNIGGKAFLQIINESPIDVVVEHGNTRYIAKANGGNIVRYIFTIKPGQLLKMTMSIYPNWEQVHEKEIIKLLLESGHVE